MSSDAEDLVSEAINLETRGDIEGAITLLEKAASLGSTDAMYNLAIFLGKVPGRSAEADDWWRKLAESGDSEGMGEWGTILSSQGRAAESEKWLRKAVESGSPEFRHNLVIHLVAEGDADGAGVVWAEIEDSEKFYTAQRVTEMLVELKHAPESAEVWLRRATEFSGIEKTADLAVEVGTLYFMTGNAQKAADTMAEWYVGDGEPPYFDEHSGELVLPVDEVERDDPVLQAALQESHRQQQEQRQVEESWEGFKTRVQARCGAPGALMKLSEMLSSEDPIRSEQLMIESAEAGFPFAMLMLGIKAREMGRFSDAESWWGRALDAGNDRGAVNTANMWEAQGDIDRAESWLVKGVEAGFEEALAALLAFADRHSRPQVALKWSNWFSEHEESKSAQKEKEMAELTQKAKEGDGDAAYQLGEMLRKHNKKKALALYRQASEAGNAPAMIALGVHENYDNDDVDAALDWYRAAADAGSAHGCRNLASTLHELGRVEEAIDNFERAIHMGSAMAMEDLAEMRFHEGNLAAAEELLVRAVSESEKPGS